MPKLPEIEKSRLLQMSFSVLGLAALELSLFLVPAGIALCAGNEVKVQPLIPLLFHAPDIVLVLLMLVMVAIYSLFYYYIFPYAGEADEDHLVSLLLAGWFLVQNHLVFWEGALPYRLLFLWVPVFLAWYKNWRFCRRLRETPLEAQFKDWYRKARWTAPWSLIVAVTFVILMNRNARAAVFGSDFERTAPVGRYFELLVPIVTYVILLAVAVRSVLRSGRFFRKHGAGTARMLASIFDGK